MILRDLAKYSMTQSIARAVSLRQLSFLISNQYIEKRGRKNDDVANCTALSYDMLCLSFQFIRHESFATNSDWVIFNVNRHPPKTHHRPTKYLPIPKTIGYVHVPNKRKNTMPSSITVPTFLTHVFQSYFACRTLSNIILRFAHIVVICSVVALAELLWRSENY